MHCNTTKLCLCITKKLASINKRRCTDFLSVLCLSCGKIKDMIFHSCLCRRCPTISGSSGAEHSGKNCDQLFLHISRPVASYQITDCFHRICSCQCCRKITCSPHILTEDGCRYVLVGTDFLRCHLYILKDRFGFSL